MGLGEPGLGLRVRAGRVVMESLCAGLEVVGLGASLGGDGQGVGVGPLSLGAELVGELLGPGEDERGVVSDIPDGLGRAGRRCCGGRRTHAAHDDRSARWGENPGVSPLGRAAGHVQWPPWSIGSSGSRPSMA